MINRALSINNRVCDPLRDKDVPAQSLLGKSVSIQRNLPLKTRFDYL